MRSRMWVMLMVVSLLVAGCGTSASQVPGNMDVVVEEPMVEAEAPAGEPAFGYDDSSDTVLTGADEMQRMIIYNGDLDLVVKDTDEAQQAILDLVEGLDGYIVNVNSWAYSKGLMNVHITVRVPAAAFNEAMTGIREVAMEINREGVSSSDVTQEYVDLESRLRALEVKAERLEELMDEAEDTEAVLAVYRELADTQQEIEQTKGRMQYLERSSAMATIEIQLTPDEISKPVEVAGWRPEGTIKRAIEALIKTFQFFADVLMWVILYVAPVLIVVFVVLFVVFKVLGLVLGGRRRKKAAQAEPEPEE
ncbi:MAG: DUF4349 domain-containing protein [Anaerolineae bacterium]|nr:DUF4349 domain-containing protein [Anaerolineae bacterium]